MIIELYRDYGDKGVNGSLFLEGRFICHTIELPWKENRPYESCITEGEYDVTVRFSKKFGWHLHIKNVYGRKWILFHPANDAEKELRGCIAPVSKLTGEGKGNYSRRAMDILMIQIRNLKRKNEQLKIIIKQGNHENKGQIKETDTEVFQNT
jgi:hypothetical protein